MRFSYIYFDKTALTKMLEPFFFKSEYAFTEIIFTMCIKMIVDKTQNKQQKMKYLFKEVKSIIFI
jgi:hypothetical protein